MSTSTPSHEDVLSALAIMIREVIGEEWADDLPIEMGTSFSNDLELESIEFVALAEILQKTYGRKVDFAGWLSKMELKAILGLTVGQVVEFIVQCHSQVATA